MMVRANALALLFLVSCGGGQTPCASAEACRAGRECLASRCVPYGTDPAPADSLRLVCNLKELSTLTGAVPAVDRNGAVELSSSSSDAVVLHFDPRWRAIERVDAAFLIAELPDDAPPAQQVDAWNVVQHPLRSRYRRLASPRGSGLVDGTRQLRIDVTETVRRWHGGQPALGVGLVRKGGGPTRLLLGTGGGLEPRLDVYGAVRQQ